MNLREPRSLVLLLCIGGVLDTGLAQRSFNGAIMRIIALRLVNCLCVQDTRISIHCSALLCKLMRGPLPAIDEIVIFDAGKAQCYLHQLMYRAIRLFNRGLGHGIGCSVGSGDHNVANRLPCINPWAVFVMPSLCRPGHVTGLCFSHTHHAVESNLIADPQRHFAPVP